MRQTQEATRKIQKYTNPLDQMEQSFGIPKMQLQITFHKMMQEERWKPNQQKKTDHQTPHGTVEKYGL